MIDSEWFYQRLEQNGHSLRDMARVLGLDASAVSRMLRGERKMSADEQDAVADYLGLSIIEIAARRRGESFGFFERHQESLKMDDEGQEDSDKAATEGSFFDRIRNKMAGTVTIPPGVDITQPADPEWGRVYDDDYEYPLHL